MRHPALPSLLGVFAHPDEFILAGGVLAQHAAARAATAVVSMTWSPTSVRAAELADACASWVPGRRACSATGTPATPVPRPDTAPGRAARRGGRRRGPADPDCPPRRRGHPRRPRPADRSPGPPPDPPSGTARRAGSRHRTASPRRGRPGGQARQRLGIPRAARQAVTGLTGTTSWNTTAHPNRRTSPETT